MVMTAPANDDHDEALEDEPRDEDKLDEVFERAKTRFDRAVMPQLEQRSLSLLARRFVNIPGAQWEGDFGDAFDNSIKLEINLAKVGRDKILRDYNENRIVPDFKPAGGKGDDDSAQTLDGLFRADATRFKSQQALDNAFMEAVDGGFGAFRLTNEWADPYDKDSDAQRINPALTIVDADQRVFFDPDSKLYDKSDAGFAFVLTAQSREAFEEQHDGSISSWDEGQVLLDGQYDWFPPDVVIKAEYYEVEDSDEKLYVLTHRLSQQEERYWDSEIDDDEIADLKKMGWQVSTRTMQRKRVHKYVMSGAEVLEDKGLIAGDCIPVVPVYGQRSYVDGVERFTGYVQERMDRQRLYNMGMSRVAETSAQSPREIPIFAAQQMPTHLADLWSRQVVERHAYALVDPLIDPGTGNIISAGPIGKVDAPQLDQSTAILLQMARTDLVEDQQDGAEQVRANTSADALEVAATRVDAKSGIFLDNMRQSVQRDGEVYLSMAADVYFEPDREVDTMNEDGAEDTAKLVENYVDKQGVSRYKNDFSRGHYRVIVNVTEATSTRRDKTVRACIAVAQAAGELGDTDLAKAALITAVVNMDGEGMTELQQFNRQAGIKLGVIEPSDEEKAAMEQAAANAQQQPDPQAEFIAAKTKESQAAALEKTASAGLKAAQADAVGGPESAPDVPSGLEAAHKAAQVAKTSAEADKIRTDTAHMPEKLRIERTNAAANDMKARHSVFAGLAKMFQRGGSGQ